MLKVAEVRRWMAGLAALLLLWPQCEPLWAQSGSRPGLGNGGFGGAPGGAAPQKQARYVPRRFAPAGPRINVAEVRLRGDISVSESRIRAKLQTRAGRQFDPVAVRSDVRTLLADGLCYDVRTSRQDSPDGVIITFELFEQPKVKHIDFRGNKVRDKTLLKHAELAVGQPLSRFRVEEARRKLIEFYQGRGNSHVQITIQEGDNDGDDGIVFQIDEGPRQRIRWTRFEGNTIVNDARLRTQIDSKPGILWLFKGQVDRDAIAEDVDRLTSYYRSLGYFKAKVTPDPQFDADQEWMTLTFRIEEGPRYVIRSVATKGNNVFADTDLLSATELRPGAYFDLAKMQSDVRTLKDAYGANGYIKVAVEATPQFDEEPGQLDLVYDIEEGGQYRVGEIIVNMNGDHPHTRQTVVLNRIDMREGDIIDIRKLRASERRLTNSQLFQTGPLGGPEIAVQPRDTGTRMATRSRSGGPY